MAYFFDEQKLKTALSVMTEDEREQYVNGCIDLLGIPKDYKQGNKSLDMAFMNLRTAISVACSSPITQQEIENMQNYLAKLG